MSDVDDAKVEAARKRVKCFLENSKEAIHLSYDYFKNIILVSSSAILITFAFFDRIGKRLLLWQKALLFFDLIIYFVMIALSLFALRKATNIIIHANDILDAIEINEPHESEAPFNKFKSGMKVIVRLDRMTRYGFLIGIVIILCLSGFMFFA